MPRINPFRADPKKSDLIRQEGGAFPLDRRNITEDRKLDYCWKVLTSGEAKYTKSYKDGAFDFLKEKLSFPTWINQSNLPVYLNGQAPRRDAFNEDQQIAFAWRVKNSPKAALRTIAHELLKNHYRIPNTVSFEAANTLIEQLKDQGLRQFTDLPMPKVDPIVWFLATSEADRQFVDAVNLKINEINTKIEEYNQSRTRPMLQDVYQLYQRLEHEFSGDQIKRCPAYQDFIHKTLFENLKLECLKHNQTLSQLAPQHSTLPPALATHPLSHILQEMSADKTQALLETLLDNEEVIDNDDLKSLYQRNEPGYEAFHDFLRTHQIEFLGGGNSKNFKITSNQGEAIVLKVDNRLGMPKQIEQKLKGKDTLKSTFTETVAERHTITQNAEYRTLLLTEYVTGSDLVAHAKKQPTNEARIQQAIHVFHQMANIVQTIEAAGAMHPDMKITNWLIDDKGQLKLADTKALLPTEEGKVNKAILTSQWFDVITTQYMNPPEIYYDGIEASKVHAFMLGKNLYHFLTNCDYSTLENQNDGRLLDFDSPIFKSPEGKVLKSLIENLVRPTPADRLDLNEAKKTLLHLQNPDYKACQQLVEDIREFKVSNRDTKMEAFCREKYELINRTPPEKLTALKDELQAVKEKLESRALAELTSIIATFKDKARFYTVGMRAKAERIEQALMNVPIEARGRILQTNTPETKAVLQALASHRHFHRKDVYLDSHGEIDEAKAATSFTKFKNANRMQRPSESAALAPVAEAENQAPEPAANKP